MKTTSIPTHQARACQPCVPTGRSSRKLRLARVIAPILLVHSGRDRVVPSSHSEWLARCCPSAELRLCPEDGHISVLGSSRAAMDWLQEHADRG